MSKLSTYSAGSKNNVVHNFHSREARDLKNVILHEFRFAYQEDEWLTGRVRAINRNNGYAGMLQALSDLAVLGKENPAPLTAINFDMTLLDKAAQLADEEGSLWAEANCDRIGYNEVKEIRNRAFTHLMEAVDKIRKFGRHVFWRNEARLIGYRSEYLYRVKRNRRNGKTLENKQEEPKAG